MPSTNRTEDEATGELETDLLIRIPESNHRSASIQDLTVEQAKLSTYSSTLNSINTMCGMSILSLPFAFSQAGIFGGIFLLLAFGFMASYTAKLLRDCIEHIRDEREAANDDLETDSLLSRSSPLLITYGDIGMEAFGSFGEALVVILFSLELFACNTAFVVIASDCLISLGADMSPLLIKALFVGLLTPFTIAGNMSLFSYSSFIGILAVTGTSVIVIARGATPNPPSWIHPSDTVRILPSDLSNVASAVGILFVGYDCHSVFPTIFDAMKERGKRFSTVVNFSYMYAFVLYSSIATLGYLMFGSDVQNLAISDTSTTSSLFFTNIILILIILNSIATYPLLLQPIINAAHGGDKAHLRTIIALSLNLLVFIVSVLLPSFQQIMSILGSAFSVMIVLILPSLCHLRIVKDSTIKKQGVLYAIALTGLFIGIVGTTSILLNT